MSRPLTAKQYDQKGVWSVRSLIEFATCGDG
jgi:hypothetical protein